MRSSLRHTRRVVARYGHARTPCSHLQSRAAPAAQPATQPPPAQTITARVQTRSLSTTASRSSSVNPEEISHFNALASSWWDPLGPSRVLHQMNPLRHDFIRQCQSSSAASSFAPGQKLRYLDVGCGGGIFAESAARLPTTESVTAIDPSTEILAVARRHAARDPALSTTLTYLNKTIDDLPLPTTSPTPAADPTTASSPEDTRFDVVSLFEVIEHVDNPSAFLDRCGQFVKPGGWLILSTIARTWTSWFTTNFVAEDVIGMVPKGTHDWNKYINEPELREFFRGRAERWGAPQVLGVVYVPGLGWKEVKGSEKVGNYFFGVQRLQ